MSSYRKVGKKIAGAAGTAMILGPIWVPALTMVNQVRNGMSIEGAVKDGIFVGSGVNLRDGKFYSEVASQAAIKGLMMVGTGIVIRKLAKRV